MKRLAITALMLLLAVGAAEAWIHGSAGRTFIVDFQGTHIVDFQGNRIYQGP